MVSPLVKAAFLIFVGVFLLAGIAVWALGDYPNSSLSIALVKSKNVIYALYLFCWMILGMMANYFWDLLRAGKSLSDVQLSKLLIPILVSPIIFFTVWALAAKEGSVDIQVTWPFVAFQNGFFWQVVFTKSQQTV